MRPIGPSQQDHRPARPTARRRVGRCKPHVGLRLGLDTAGEVPKLPEMRLRLRTADTNRGIRGRPPPETGAGRIWPR